MKNSKPIILKPQECKLTLETPFATFTTDQYLVLIKDGNECHIECNDLDYDDLVQFREQLDYILNDFKSELEGEGLDD